MKISAIVITKNEKENIYECLKSIFWCDEIIIVDDNSSDNTIKIVKEFKHQNLKFFSHPLGNNFSKQRNFGLEKATNEWILFVDADERISEALACEIKNEILNSKNNFNGFFIKRRDYMWGKELRYGEVGSIKLLRLAKKNAGVWDGKVHEEWKIKGEIGELKNVIFHYPHKSMDEFLKEINFYTTLRAQELFEKGVKANFLSIIIYPKMKFIQNFFFRCGFLDGISGLIFAMTMSLHSFLVRGKLWSLWNKKEK